MPQFLVAPSTLNDGIEHTVSHKHWAASAVLPVLLLMLKTSNNKGSEMPASHGKNRGNFPERETDYFVQKPPILTMPKNQSKIIKGIFSMTVC